MDHIYDQPQFGENWFTYPGLYSRFVRELPSGSKIVEVGSWKGKSIAYLGVEIINSGKDIKVDAVDTWKGSDEHRADHYVLTDTLYQLFLSNIASVDPKWQIVKPVRSRSVDAAKAYADESLDVVFIDACHLYECVKEDIAAWLPKVKKGGYLAGHDYSWSPDHVKRAVDDSVSPIEETEGCWVYRKPL
jgi:two-component SAPR family response regulator